VRTPGRAACGPDGDLVDLSQSPEVGVGSGAGRGGMRDGALARPAKHRGVARMARFGVRSGSVAFARSAKHLVDKRFERTGANPCEHRWLLPCRRSWVRVPSSALNSLQIGGCRRQVRKRWLQRGCIRGRIDADCGLRTDDSCLQLEMAEASRVRECPANCRRSSETEPCCPVRRRGADRKGRRLVGPA